MFVQDNNLHSHLNDLPRFKGKMILLLPPKIIIFLRNFRVLVFYELFIRRNPPAEASGSSYREVLGSTKLVGPITNFN
jgi:hypothetical protein